MFDNASPPLQTTEGSNLWDRLRGLGLLHGQYICRGHSLQDHFTVQERLQLTATPASEWPSDVQMLRLIFLPESSLPGDPSSHK